ncbi:MAG: ABC transporter substrate-binding protein [Anaerolineae bacterium]|nr:ABC transporter substrate-binding protein [Anaerolineae bacterium]
MLPQSTRPVVKIGLIAPFEGLGRPVGYEVLYGVKLALQERNAAGGVAGYRVLLVALNDDDDAGHAARQASKLDVDGDVLGVIGPLSRTTVRAVAEPLAAAGLAWVVPASAPDEVIAAQANAFRLFAGDAELAEAAIRQALAAAAARQVAVSPTGDFAPPLRAAAERLGVYRPSPGLPQWGRDGGGSSPVALGGNAEQVADELLELPAGVVAVAGPEAGRAVVAQRAGTAAEGLIWVSSAPPAERLPQAFVSGYQALAGGPPGPYALLAYDATNVLLDAIELDIEQHGRPTRPGVVAALSATALEGLGGEVRFDEQGCWLQAPVFAYRIAGEDIFARP